MLKNITLNGFKSFAKRSSLDFGSNVTAIVGPNGSGKSNIVEAFRFVLGEQSIKSMRGKTGADLIFNGSKSISKLNRAKVSVVFNNTNRQFKIVTDNNNVMSLDFDEIEISREVFADGVNKYSVNGTEVRLKDVHEILSCVHVGASGHHIISQGQADRLLSSTSKERKTMIEDALGLKVYQLKIRDAEKKIEKTKVNMREVELLRKEIAPHMKYLKRQVEKIQQSQELKNKLSGEYVGYLRFQDSFLHDQYTQLHEKQSQISKNIEDLDSVLATFGPEIKENTSEHVQAIQKEKQKLQELQSTKESVSRMLIKFETTFEIISQQTTQDTREDSQSSFVKINQEDMEQFIRDCNVFIDSALKTDSLEQCYRFLGKIKNSLQTIKNSFAHPENTRTSDSSKDSEHEKNEILQNIESTKKELQKILDSINAQTSVISEMESQLELYRDSLFDKQKKRYEIEKERARIVSEQTILHEKLQRVRSERHRFEEEIQEGVTLVGREILSFKDTKVLDENIESIPSYLEEKRRMIERLKIKLEESGALGGDDVLKEYEEVTERDVFLEKELHDLQTAMTSLQDIVSGLKETLEREFENGVEKINTQFKDFFAVMFGGGSASLFTVVIPQKNQTDDYEENEGKDDVVTGLDIEVSLPQKKIKDLAMLSGGERSLTSIALLFAITQVNPPPFLILDETDAALDEANSRRYGDMIQKLAEYSQLIVVTHNRETMSRASALYGITIGSDGASKLLSINFSQAKEHSK
jgi:chromosome segregation protein